MYKSKNKCVVVEIASVCSGQSASPLPPGSGEAGTEPEMLGRAPIPFDPVEYTPLCSQCLPLTQDELVSRWPFRDLGKLSGRLLCEQLGCPNRTQNKADLRAPA